MAFPPFFRISTPALEASSWAEETIPFLATTSSAIATPASANDMRTTRTSARAFFISLPPPLFWVILVYHVIRVKKRPCALAKNRIVGRDALDDDGLFGIEHPEVFQENLDSRRVAGHPQVQGLVSGIIDE